MLYSERRLLVATAGKRIGGTLMAPNISAAVTVAMPTPPVRERPARSLAGLPVLVICLLGLVVVNWLLIGSGANGAAAPGGQAKSPAHTIGILLDLFLLLVLAGLTAVLPGEARVVQLFGGYTGTVRTSVSAQ